MFLMKFKDTGFNCKCPGINRIEKKNKNESYLCRRKNEVSISFKFIVSANFNLKVPFPLLFSYVPLSFACLLFFLRTTIIRNVTKQ